VTQLRSLMLDEIQRRNFTEPTRRAYLRIIEEFAGYFHRPPDQLGPEHIREYIAPCSATGNLPITQSIRLSERCGFSSSRC
jgi:hypothetical protein